MRLSELQEESRKWLAHNFPNQVKHQALLGVVEEVGELSHAFLKSEQGIRGTKEEHLDAMVDAIGDITIYLASFCNTNGINFEAAVILAWGAVSQRDWIKYPSNGRDK